MNKPIQHHVHPGYGDPRAARNILRWEVNFCLTNMAMPEKNWHLARALTGELYYQNLVVLDFSRDERRVLRKIERWWLAGHVIHPSSTTT